MAYKGAFFNDLALEKKRFRTTASLCNLLI